MLSVGVLVMALLCRRVNTFETRINAYDCKDYKLSLAKISSENLSSKILVFSSEKFFSWDSLRGAQLIN